MAHYKIGLSILVLVLHIIVVDNLSLVFTKHRRNIIIHEDPISEDELTTTAQSNFDCKDELPFESCQEVMNKDGGCDAEHPKSWRCRRSCQLCNIERDSPDNSSLNYENQRDDEQQQRAKCKCVDAMQDCNVISNPVICCMMAPIMNMSCQKSCLFCYDMQSPVPGGGMPGMPLPSAPSVPGQNQPVIYQNPCNPQMPPQIMTECPELQNPFPSPGGSNNNNPFPNTAGSNNNPFPNSGGSSNNNNNNQQISQTINIPQTNQG